MQYSLTFNKKLLSCIATLLLFTITIFAQITVDRYMGINTLREDPINKMKAVGFIREYHSWYLNEGNPSTAVPMDYSPSYPNALYRWDKVYQDLTYTNFGEFYNEIRNTYNIQIAPTFLGNLFQIVDPTRTTNQSDNHIVQEQIPIAPNANALDPASYKAHAAYLFHYAARYGHNTFNPTTFNSLIVPRTHPDETPKTGLGLVEYMESWNEQDKWWWQGQYPNTYFTPQQYATMLSADYDGHGQTLGAGIGIKNADPTMKVVMGGLAQANLGYIREMVNWSVNNRTNLSSPYGVLPFQVLNIHHYIGNNPNFLQSTEGVSPEHADLRGFLSTFSDYRDSLETAFNVELELWLSEFGYDTYAPGSIGTPVVIAPTIGPNDSYEVQGQWITRIYLEALAAGVDRAMLFFLRDETTPYTGLYSSSGLLESREKDFKPKNSWFYVHTMKNVLTDMVFDADVSPCSDTSCVRIYRFVDVNQGNKRVYAIWNPTSSAKVTNYEFTEENVEDQTLVRMELPSIWGSSWELTEGNPTIEVTEKPAFIVVNGDFFKAEACTANPTVENPTCGSLNVRLNAPSNSGVYQLWYQPGDLSAADFSLQDAFLVDDALNWDAPVITVPNLIPSQDYTFFAFPDGVAASETEKICSTVGTTISGSCKIVVNPNWIYDDYKNTLNPDGLFDNQNEFDPFCDPNAGFPASDELWGFNFSFSDSMNVSVDLQAYYYINAFTLHDEGSRGLFTIQYADSPNGPWTTAIDYLTIDFNKWITLTNVLPPNKPIRYLRFIAEKNDAAKVGEIFLCGDVSNYDPDILPGPGINGIVKDITCESLTLEWDHPFDNDIREYKIYSNNSLIATIPYNPSKPTFPISNLDQGTTYNYSITTIDLAGQASATDLNLSGTTFGGINLCKIPLDPSMIYDSHRVPDAGQKLVDEQGVYDPKCHPGFFPTDFWGPDYQSNDIQHVSFDLQQYYTIDEIIIHDGGNALGTVKIRYADSPNGPWTTIRIYNAVSFNGWISFENPIPNNPLVRYLRMEASNDDNVAIGEIYICGTADPTYNPDIRPGRGSNLKIKALSCDTAALEWVAPFDNDIKEYKIFGAPQPITTTNTEVVIKNLIENTNYTFKIITIDMANQESIDTLMINLTTLEDGECDLVCNYNCACAICIRSSWVTSLNPLSNYDKAALTDEQDKVPLCETTGSVPQNFWFNSFANGSNGNPPDTVHIDLQQIYELSECHFFAQGNFESPFKIEYLNMNGQWVEFVNFMGAYGWHTYDNLTICTKVLRLIQNSFNGQIGEFGLCGVILEECAPLLETPYLISLADTFKAANIVSAATIGANISVGYMAEQTITLRDGFQVTSDSEFIAKIEDCDNTVENLNSIATAHILPTSNKLFNANNKMSVFPNPFQQSTTIAYQLQQPATIQLDIFDATGKIINTLINNQLTNKGSHQAVFYANDTKGGFFIARLVIGEEVLVQKIVMVGG